MKICAAALLSVLFLSWTAGGAWRQQPDTEEKTATQTRVKTQKKRRSPAGDVGSGAGDIAKGAAKGAGNTAKGVGEGALDLVTLHPMDAAASLGKGAGYAGKDVVVGTTKGTGKIAKGLGRGIKHLF